MIALFLRHMQQTPPSSSHACLHASHKQMHLSPSPDVVSVHLAVTWCPYPPFKPHSERLFSQVGQVACYVTLFFVYVVLCCILHDISTFQSPQEPSGAPSQGQSVQQWKDALALQGQNLSFISFIHQMWHCMHRIICVYWCDELSLKHPTLITMRKIV